MTPTLDPQCDTDFADDGAPICRARVRLSDEQLEKIAERAAVKAVEMMTNQAYTAIGKGVVQRLFWVVGVTSVAAALWAAKNGYIKLP